MLHGKTAIVTGSTSGIGLGIAEAFARAGANIVLNGFGDTMQIERTRADLAHRTNAMIVYSPADMSKPRAIERPIPRLPPATTTRLPCKAICMCASAALTSTPEPGSGSMVALAGTTRIKNSAARCAGSPAVR